MKTGIVKQWEKKRVKYVFREVDDRSRDGKETLLSVSEYYGVRPRSESFGDAEFLSRAETLEGYKKCVAGDLVINIMLAWKRGLGVTPVDGIVSPAYNVFRLRGKETSPEYYHYLLRTDEYLAEFTRRSTGIMASRLRMYPDSFMDVRLHVPPTAEQRRIAAYLDEATAKVDRLIKLRERQMELLREQRAALIQQAVTRGLNPRAPLKDSGLPWLGQMPKHWTMKRLKYITPQVTVGIVINPSSFYVEEGVPCLRSLNVRPGQLITENLVFIESESHRAMSKSAIYRGDLVAVRTGQPGTTAVVDERFDNANCIDLIIIRSSPHFVSEFLEHILNSSFAKSQFDSGSDGAIQQHFNIQTAKNLIILLPPVDEQREILAHIERETAKLDGLHRSYERQLALLAEYRASLIHECVIGQRALPN